MGQERPCAAGLIDSSIRGVWRLSEEGRKRLALSDADAQELSRRVRARPRYVTFDGMDDGAPNTPQQMLSRSADGIRDQLSEELLDRIRALSPVGFERFCGLLFRTSGFKDVKVTGRSGDGGLDGNGVLEVNSLLSFKVFFQCKKYASSRAVSSSEVRDFRGGMVGRSSYGVVLTTGVFTVAAEREATREGVPPIELVDGEKLVKMCQENGLGLREVRTFVVDDRFFDQFEA